jgi:hypothetical protein
MSRENEEKSQKFDQILLEIDDFRCKSISGHPGFIAFWWHAIVNRLAKFRSLNDVPIKITRKQIKSRTQQLKFSVKILMM